jgi:hypothetical protein
MHRGVSEGRHRGVQWPRDLADCGDASCGRCLMHWCRGLTGRPQASEPDCLGWAGLDVPGMPESEPCVIEDLADIGREPRPVHATLRNTRTVAFGGLGQCQRWASAHEVAHAADGSVDGPTADGLVAATHADGLVDVPTPPALERPWPSRERPADESLSRLMRSLPSDAVASLRGGADRPASLASECYVPPRMPRESMPRSYRGLSLCLIALRASALPLALAWASFKAVSFLRQWKGLAWVGSGSWPRGGHGPGGLSPACLILTPVLRATSRLPTARVGPQLGGIAWMLWPEVPQ